MRRNGRWLLLGAVCWASLVSVALAEVPVKGDRAMLDFLRNVQIANQARYPAGKLQAEYTLKEGENPLEKGIVAMEWDGDKTYLDCTHNAREVKGEEHVECIDDGKLVFTFYHKQQILPIRLARSDKRDRLPSEEYFVRPSERWFEFRGARGRGQTIDKMLDLDSELNAKVLKEVVITREGNRVLVNLQNTIATIELEFSLEHGGNLVRSDSHVNDPLIVQTSFTFSWVDDGIGGYRLAELHSNRYRQDYAEDYTLKITSFDPNYKPDPGRFVESSLHVPQGTKVYENIGNKRQEYYLGGKQTPDLDTKLPRIAEAIKAGDEPKLKLHWEDNFLTISGEHLPCKEIKVHYLEAYCRAKCHDQDWEETVIGHTTKLVEETKAGDEVRLICELKDGVRVGHIIKAAADKVTFELLIHNPGDKPSEVHWAQPCIRLDEFTGQDETEYIPHCFILLDGKITRLPTKPWATKARYTPGQVYRAPGVAAEDVNPRPLSDLVPSGSLCGCYSHDGKWILATAWEPYQEVFQGVRTCLHADFRIGGLKAGEMKLLHGAIYVVPATDEEALLERFRKDFPEQGGESTKKE